MAIQFIEGYREANVPNRNQPELAMPGLLEELKKKVNRPVPDLPLSEEASALKSAKPASAYYTNGGARTVATLSDAIKHFQQDAPTCPSCGHLAVRNGACYKCLNCGESLGCS
jgi:hypothetical protein